MHFGQAKITIALVISANNSTTCMNIQERPEKTNNLKKTKTLMT